MATRKTTEPDVQGETINPTTGEVGSPDTAQEVSAEELLRIQEEKVKAEAEKAKAEAENEALRKQLEEAQKELAKKESKSVAEGSVKEPTQPPKNMVTVELFKDSTNYVDDVFVAVNGETYQIQRGVAVEVPDYVKAVLDLSKRQDNETARKIEAAAKKAAKKAAEMNEDN